MKQTKLKLLFVLRSFNAITKFIMNFITGIFKIIFSILISLVLVFPIFTLIFGINEIRRIFVKIYLRLKFGSNIEISNGADGAYGFSSRAIIRILCVFDTNYSFKKLQASFTDNILNLKDRRGQFAYKKFRSRFVTEAGYGCWKLDENFDSNNHFRYLQEDPEMSESRLMALIEDLEQEMPQNRPQWEVIFIPRLPNSNESGLIFRIHHSYGDGLSIINALAEKVSSDKPFPYVIHPVKHRIPFWAKLAFYLRGYTMFGWTLLHNILNKPTPIEDRHPEAPETAIHSARSKLSLMQLKSIQKKTSGATLSAILMTAIKNALDKLNKGPLDLTSFVIVAKLPYPEGKLANRITCLTVKVPQRDEENWANQLKAINKETNVSNNLTYFVNNTINLLLGRMPTATLKAAQANVKNVLIVSNLPFVTRSINLADGLMTDCFVWPTLQKSLMVSTLSIGDSLNVTINSGGNMLNQEELQYFVKEIHFQLKTMESLN